MPVSDLRSELMDAVDGEWAELVRHLPISGGQADPSREPLEFYALLRTADQTAQDMNFGRGNFSRAALMAGGGALRIDRTSCPGREFKQGDKIVALVRNGEPIFEISSIDARSHLRLICILEDAN